MDKQLCELAKIIRSKNSGPFEVTLDILFDNEESYRLVKNSGVISEQLIIKLYGIMKNELCCIVFFDAALGIKITFLRNISSGTIGDRDVYGAQQHAPLMNVIIS